jgi:3-oxoacid CoA-transferase subunit B
LSRGQAFIEIITNLGVLDITHKGLHIVETADGVTREDIIAATEATIV